VDQQTRQALKHDQFVDTTAHGLEWASENRRSLVVTGSIILALILVIVGSYFVYQRRSEQASVAFGEAMQAYQTPLAQPGQAVPPGVKTFPSAADRAKAANALFLSVADKYGMTPNGKLSLAQLYRQTGRDAQAIDLYNELTAKPATTVPAGLAQLQLAELYENEGKPDAAKKIYAQLKDKDAKGPAGQLATQKLNPAAAGPAAQ